MHSVYVRLGILVEDNSREIIQSACRSVGSVKDNEFDVRFNPDLFQPHVSLNQTVRGKRSPLRFVRHSVRSLHSSLQKQQQISSYSKKWRNI